MILTTSAVWVGFYTELQNGRFECHAETWDDLDA